MRREAPLRETRSLDAAAPVSLMRARRRAGNPEPMTVTVVPGGPAAGTIVTVAVRARALAEAASSRSAASEKTIGRRRPT